MDTYRCHIETIIDEIHEELVEITDRNEFLSKLVLSRIENNTDKINKSFDRYIDIVSNSISKSDISSTNKAIKSLVKVLNVTYKNLINEFNNYDKFLSNFDQK